MPFTYRLRMWDLNNVPQGSLFVGEPFDMIDFWTVEGNGNCLEMSIKAKVIDLSSQPEARFIGQLQSSDDGVYWRDHFKGYVSRSGAARNNTRESEIKLVGLKERFYEIVLDNLVVAGADVGAMVRSVVSQIVFIPVGVTTPSASANALVPDTSFSLSDRYPNLESVGDFLDAMAATISNATWGVNASGDFFFLVAAETYNVLSEGNGVFINWEEPDAENVVDKVTLILADKPFPESGVGNVIRKFGFVYFYANNYVAFPIAHRYDSGAGYDSEALILLPWSEAWLSSVAVGLSTLNFTTIANIIDSDPATYSELTGTEGYIQSSAATSRIVSLNVRYSSTESASIKVLIKNGDDADGVIGSELIFELPSTEGAVVNQDLITPISATYTGATDANSWRFDVKANDGAVRIYEITTYTLNTSLLDDVAEAYIQLPAEDVGNVKAIGLLLNPSTFVDLTLLDGTEIRVPTELYTSRITRDGLETTFRVGQKFSSDDTAINKLENDRLEKNKRNAVRFRR